MQERGDLGGNGGVRGGFGGFGENNKTKKSPHSRVGGMLPPLAGNSRRWRWGEIPAFAGMGVVFFIWGDLGGEGDGFFYMGGICAVGAGMGGWGDLGGNAETGKETKK